MDALEFLSQFPNHREFSRKSKILIFAFYLRRHRGQAEFGTTDIRTCFEEAMLRIPSDLSGLLRTLSTGRESPLIRGRTTGRYALSIHGQSEVQSILPPSEPTESGLSSFLEAAVPYLRKTIVKVQDDTRREFLAEAIACLAVEARRATIVMTWLATLDHLFEYVLTHKITDFNSALTRRTDRLSKLNVSNRDDFLEMKDSVFIEVCRSARIITNDVRRLMDEKLGIRNSCAHPGTFQVGDSKVVSYIEDLVENVIAKYEI